MAFDNTTTIIGNLTRDPELNFISSGAALCKFSIADNQKKADGETEPHYFDCVAWRELAEHIAESFTSGQRIIVHGKLIQSRWTNEDGQNRQKVEITVEDAGHSLKWATSIATKDDAKSSSRPFKSEPPVPKHEPF